MTRLQTTPSFAGYICNFIKNNCTAFNDFAVNLLLIQYIDVETKLLVAKTILSWMKDMQLKELKGNI